MVSRTRSIRGAAVLLVVTLVGGVLASDERTPEVFLQLGDLLYEESRYREAVEAYDRARGGADGEISYRASTGLVRSLLRTAEFSRARREAVTLSAAHPRSADALALHGDTLWSAGLFPEAEVRYRDILSVDPAHARAHHGMARLHTVSRGFDAALDEVRAAIRQNPTEPEFHHTEGYIHERRGQFTEAADALRRFQNLLPARDREERALLTRAQIRFLDSFEGRTPFAIDEATARRVHTVPFRIVRDKIVVEGRVNGGRSVDFVLDTGAEMTVIGRRTAERHGIHALGFTMSAGVGEAGLRGLQLGRLDELSIGTFTIRDVPTLIKSPALRGLPTREGESWSPVALGLSTVIDYGKRTLTFGRMRLEPGELEMPMYLYRLAMVRGTVNDKEPASFIVDTGGEVISISTSMATAIGPSRTRRIPLKVYGSSGWDRDAFLYPGLDLAFDRIRFDNFATVVLNLRAPSALLGIDLGGIVGHRFLSRYRVGIDLEAGLLKLSQLPGGSALPRGAQPVASARLPLSDALRPSPE
jgi:predicted aspartyl protease/Flp pilus assembly protein TadD